MQPGLSASSFASSGGRGDAVAWAVGEACRRAGKCPPAGPGDHPDVRVVRSRPTVVVAAGEVVVKVHEPGTDAGALAARLEAAAVLAPVLLAPGDARPLAVPQERPPLWASAWPCVDPLPLDTDPDGVPWATAGGLLARLHAHGPVPGLPAHRAPARLARDLSGMESALDAAADRGPAGAAAEETRRAADVVRRAVRTLPAAARAAAPAGRPVTVVHGDFHLGQLARSREPGGGWLLIDVDDVGNGDPVWDLARPAAFWACGLLADAHWRRFLAGYRAGCAAFGAGADAFGLGGQEADDPWPVLDSVTRPCVVQSAAAAVRRAVDAGTALDVVDRRLLAACQRIAAGP